MLAWAPHAVLASLPFFTALLKLLYRQQPHGAHFVFALHLHAAWYLMLTFLVLVSWGMDPAVVALWASVYAWMALRRVYGVPGSARCRGAPPGPTARSLPTAFAAGGDGALSVGEHEARCGSPRPSGSVTSKSVTPTSMPAWKSRVVTWPRWWVWWLKKCSTSPRRRREDAGHAGEAEWRRVPRR